MKVMIEKHFKDLAPTTWNREICFAYKVDEKGRFFDHTCPSWMAWENGHLVTKQRESSISTADKLSALYESLEEWAFKEIPLNDDVDAYFAAANTIYTNYKKNIGLLDKIFVPDSIKRVENIYRKIKNLAGDSVYLLHKTIEHGGNVREALQRIARSSKEINDLKGDYCALHLMILKKDIRAIRLIVDHGADITQLTRSGQSAFELALRTGDLRTVQEVWKCYSEETQKRMATGSKWAFILAETGNQDIMNWVLQNVVTGRSLADGHRFLAALEKAMQKNHVRIAQSLMAALNEVITNPETNKIKIATLKHFSMVAEKSFARVSQALEEARSTGMQGVAHTQMRDLFDNLRESTTNLLNRHKEQIQEFQKNINSCIVSRTTDLLKRILEPSDDPDIQQLQTLENLSTALKAFPQDRLYSVIHTLDEKGFSLLHYALMNPQTTPEMLDLLHTRAVWGNVPMTGEGVWRNVPKTKDGRHPLQLACQNPALELYVLKYEASDLVNIARYGSARQLRHALNQTQHQYSWLFIQVIQDKSKEKVQVLLDAGFDITGIYNGESPFVAAVQSGDLELAQFVFSKLTSERQGKELSGIWRKPFTIAVQNGDLPMVQWLFGHVGYDIILTSDLTSDLSKAVSKKHLEIVRFLLRQLHASVENRKQRRQDSSALELSEKTILPAYSQAFSLAVTLERDNVSDQIIEELKAAKAKLERLKTELQQRRTTPLIHAVQFGDLDQVTQALKSVTDTEEYDGEGYTAIHRAIQMKDKAKLKAIWGVLKSAPRDTQTGYTVAQVAVATGDVEIYSEVQRLFQSTSYTTTKEWSTMFLGYSAVYLAAKNGHLDMLKMLVEKEKYSPYSSNTKGTCATALHAAAEEGHLEIVEYLIKESRKREQLDREQHENGNFVSSPFIARTFYLQRNSNGNTAAQLAEKGAEKLLDNNEKKKRYQKIITLLQPPRQEYISIEEPVPSVTSGDPSAPAQSSIEDEEALQPNEDESDVSADSLPEGVVKSVSNNVYPSLPPQKQKRSNPVVV